MFTSICYSQQQVIGYFDVADTDQGCQGWALDPDNPNASVSIHFYANKPAGQAGSVFIGSTVANISRPDVNAATGYPGNHGFNWKLPTHLTTPCRIKIYAYGIDLNGNGNPNLTNSPKTVPFLTKKISKSVANHLLTISASSRYAGAINSLTWKGKEFIDTDDHGRELQSAASFYASIDSWAPECYNPTEAGNHGDGNGTCTSSELLILSNQNGVLYSETQMAFYSNPIHPTSSCPSPQNQNVLSNHKMEKWVSLNVPNIPHAIKYDVRFSIPNNESNLARGQFEVVTGYLKAEFSKIYRYNQLTNVLTPSNCLPNGERGEPVVIATPDGNYAMGIYSPEILVSSNLGYGQFQWPGDTYKWNFVRRIDNLIPGNKYSFSAYICVGSLNEVKITLNQLSTTYPNNQSGSRLGSGTDSGSDIVLGSKNDKNISNDEKPYIYQSAKNEIVLSSKKEILEMKVFDMNGKEISLQAKINHKINTISLKSGMYILLVSNADNSIDRFKFIK